MKLKHLIAATLLLPFLAGLAPAADGSLAGVWEGEVDNPPLKFTMTFEKSPRGLRAVLDMPARGIEGLALTELKYEGGKLSFVVPVPETPVKCEATRKEDGSFKGTYHLGQQSGAFSMKPASVAQ